MIWHPDKHAEGPDREAAAKTFIIIQAVRHFRMCDRMYIHAGCADGARFSRKWRVRVPLQAYNALMNSDEEAAVEALTHH
jgi:hypothetical protein